MVTVNIVVTDDAVQPEIYLGRQGEKQAREIVFDLSALREKYGAGTATLYHQRSKDPAPYLIAETTGTTMTWTVSETDTVYAGIGYCEFRYTFGTEGLSKSTMFATNVKASLSGDVIIPPAMQAWYDALIDYIDEHGGGSLTALPIIETLAGDISAYIPTNVISITDGQIFLESELFNSGQRPAVNYGLSVSRVGGAAQTKAMKKAAGNLRIDLAQFKEMEIFTQFSSELDQSTAELLAHGRMLTELLKQPLYNPMPHYKQVILLYAAQHGLFEYTALPDLKDYVNDLMTYIESYGQDIISEIEEKKVLDDELGERIERIVTAFEE